ncbi:MAG: C-GCAxxG-C-C family protein [Anaerotruncus sp.]|nr:C-GCAxxG-C-C family protein [Anaerotruncus sp.]
MRSQVSERRFLKKGTLSRALFFILDREFGRPQDNEERAAELLAGGIAKQGYQCGLLRGAVFAVGAVSLR